MDNNSINIENSLSVVMLVYNEAGVIDDVIRNFYEKVVKNISNSKLIIVEDGSVDGTKEILRELSKEIPFVLISSKKRKGYSGAFKDALRMVDTEWVFFSDSDNQHNPADFFKLLKEIDGNDIVSGYKSPRYDPMHRVIISKVYNFLIYLLFGLKMIDIDSGFKLIKKEVINNVLGDVVSFKYCIMSEFILKAYLTGYRIREVPVSHYPRKFGKTAIFTPATLPWIISGLIKDIFELKVNYLRDKNR